MRTRWLAVLALAAGCAAGEEAAGPAWGGSGGGGPAGKADCPDCDAGGPGALVQAGLADRFYGVGEQWQVAWQFTQRGDHEKQPVLHVDPLDLPLEDSAIAGRSQSEVFLFDYAVTAVETRPFEIPGGRVQREVATVEITPGDPQGTAHPEVFSQQRLGRFEPKFRFEMNDLLEPVAETLFTRSHPNGLRIEVDRVSRLQTGSSLFPHTVPRVLVTPKKAFGDDLAEGMTPEVAAAADAFAPGWRTRAFNLYTFEGVGEAEGQADVVAWAQGDMWPFYVRTDQGQGVLVGE